MNNINCYTLNTMEHPDTKIIGYNYLFGQKILAHHKFTRQRVYKGVRWLIEEIDPLEVVVIGKRSIKEGRMVSGEYTSGFSTFEIFEADRTIDALLVVKNMNTKPFYIPLPESDWYCAYCGKQEIETPDNGYICLSCFNPSKL